MDQLRHATMPKGGGRVPPIEKQRLHDVRSRDGVGGGAVADDGRGGGGGGGVDVVNLLGGGGGTGGEDSGPSFEEFMKQCVRGWKSVPRSSLFSRLHPHRIMSTTYCR